MVAGWYLDHEVCSVTPAEERPALRDFPLMNSLASAVNACLTPPSDSFATWYSYATLLHWLHMEAGVPTDPPTASRVIESIKPPFQTRIWYQYNGQEAATNAISAPTFPTGAFDKPTAVSRVLCVPNTTCNPATATQLWQYTYHSTSGNITSQTDPVLRQSTYTYNPTGIDLLSVTNTTGGGGRADPVLTLGSYVQHRPGTVTGPNGATTTLTYNSLGQLLASQDPLGNVWIRFYSQSNHRQVSRLRGARRCCFRPSRAFWTGWRDRKHHRRQ